MHTERTDANSQRRSPVEAPKDVKKLPPSVQERGGGDNDGDDEGDEEPLLSLVCAPPDGSSAIVAARTDTLFRVGPARRSHALSSQ